MYLLYPPYATTTQIANITENFPVPPFGDSLTKEEVIIIACIGSALGLVLIIGFVCWRRKPKKTQRRRRRHDSLTESQLSSTDYRTEYSNGVANYAADLPTASVENIYVDITTRKNTTSSQSNTTQPDRPGDKSHVTNDTETGELETKMEDDWDADIESTRL